MKEVIKTVKAEIERLKPIVDEYHRLENLLAFLEGPTKSISSIDDKTIQKKGSHGAIEIRVDSSMPEEIREQYNLKVGDVFNSVQELARLIHKDKNTVNRWKWRDGWLVPTKNVKPRADEHAVRVTEYMPTKLQLKYNIQPGDFWHTSTSVIDKLGVSRALICSWRKNNYIEYFEL